MAGPKRRSASSSFIQPTTPTNERTKKKMAPKRGNSGSPGKRLSKEFIDDSDDNEDQVSEDGDYGTGKIKKATTVKKEKKPAAKVCAPLLSWDALRSLEECSKLTSSWNAW